MIDTTPLDADADAWMTELRGSEEAQERLAAIGLERIRRAVAARRIAGALASVTEPIRADALVVRLGYGDGDALVDGRYDDAVEIPRRESRDRRTTALRPQERMAAILGGRETPLVCEELALRARADLDSGRGREAALQLRVALEALLAESGALASPGQEEDLALLDSRRSMTGEGANEALRGALTEERLAEVAETLRVIERVLRRRSARG